MQTDSKIKLALIGDVFPAELPYTQGYGIKSQFARHNGQPWERKIKELIGENDLVIGNLESPLLYHNPHDKKTFYGVPGFGNFLVKCGINVVNIANNHILEHGTDGFASTVEIAQSAGLEVVGVDEKGLSNIVVKEVKGKKIAIAGFSDVDLHIIKNKDQFAVLDKENVLNTIKIMDEHQPDIKVVCFHWGKEYIHIPDMYQRELAHTFIDEGVDIIAGHHSHVIQPYEVYKNGHIFYSLGNFMFDFIHSRMFGIGLIATLEINEDNTITTNLKGVKLTYKNLVESVPEHIFKAYYSKIEKLYAEKKQLPDDLYSTTYSDMRSKNRSQQRMLMKLSIVKEFIRIKGRDKIHLLSNLSSYYTKYFIKIIRR